MKRHFAAHHFRCHTFASGTWRGTGVSRLPIRSGKAAVSRQGAAGPAVTVLSASAVGIPQSGVVR